MHTSATERITDWAVWAFLWGFRILVLLIVVVGTIQSLRSGQYTSDQWIDFVVFGIARGSIYAVLALGYTMVYGILRMINFAHGDVFMAGAFAGYFVANGFSRTGFLERQPVVALLIAVLFAMLVSTTIAVVLERIAYRPLRAAPRLVPLISALGASFFIEYSFRGFFGPGVYAYPAVAPLAGEFNILGIGVLKMQALVVVAAVIMMAILYTIVMRTKIGKAMRAVSENKDVARLMGIDVDRTIVATFAIGAAMAGAGGVLFGLMFHQVNFLSGFVPGIKAFAAAVLGGIGNVVGAMVGGMVLGVFESVGPALFLGGVGIIRPYQLQDAIAYIMLVLVLLFRPSGILGERLSTKKA
ncbi:MAG TPA: branched-chain amino acid ABC transporter permease [Anaerolineales bacterium]|nr:branched-chain amino acid ABC transporter permease [Anaerolineales bacterium]